MNPTLERFDFPRSAVRAFDHWVVLIRPIQSTPLSCIIAARSDVVSLGALSSAAFAELPRVIAQYEATVRSLTHAAKFNYMALMMVDPNPHFHAIPRYPAPVPIEGTDYPDLFYPRPIDPLHDLDVAAKTREHWRQWLSTRWREE